MEMSSLCRLSRNQHISTTPKSVAETNNCHRLLVSPLLTPYALAPAIVAKVTFTSKLSRFAPYGRLFFNWHPDPWAHKEDPFNAHEKVSNGFNQSG
jgi:hypothetical protein